MLGQNRAIEAIVWGLAVLSYAFTITKLVWYIWAHEGWMYEACTRWKSSSHEKRDRAFHRKVLGLMEMQRIDGARRAVVWVAHCASIMLVIMVVECTGEEFRDFDKDDKMDLFIDLVPVTFVLITGMLGSAMPRLITPVSMDLLHTVIMGVLTVCVTQRPHANMSLRDFWYTTSFRLVTFAVLGNMSLAMVLNLMYTLFSLASLALHEDGPRHFASEILSLMAIAAITWMLRSSRVSAARAELEAAINNRNKDTIHRMLAVLCDAVAHLDGDLAISHPAPQLAALLLKPPSDAPLLGASFLELLVEPEQQRICNQLRRRAQLSADYPKDCEDSGGGSDVATSMHTHMKDASGSVVPVQVYHVSFVDAVDGCNHFIIGVREDQEQPTQMHMPSLTNRSSEAELGPPSTLAMRSRDPFFNGPRDAAVSAHVDISTDDFQVRMCSQRFAELFADCIQRSASFLKILEKSQRRAFVRWTQTSLNKLVHGPGKQVAPSAQVLLAVPQRASTKITMSATVELSLPDERSCAPSSCSGSSDAYPGKEKEQEDGCVLMFVLRGIQCIASDRASRQGLGGARGDPHTSAAPHAQHVAVHCSTSWEFGADDDTLSPRGQAAPDGLQIAL